MGEARPDTMKSFAVLSLVVASSLALPAADPQLLLAAKPYINTGAAAGPVHAAFGDLVSTANGLRSLALEGFSEDVNQDGFVDPIGQAVVAAPVVTYAAAPVVHHVASPVISYTCFQLLPLLLQQLSQLLRKLLLLRRPEDGQGLHQMEVCTSLCRDCVIVYSVSCHLFCIQLPRSNYKYIKEQ